MSAFRKKPVVVLATQWWPGQHVDGVLPFDDEDSRVRDAMHESLSPGDDPKNYGWCPTLKGGHKVSPGDWIITGVHGEKYPCKPDIFAKTYEVVDPVKHLTECIGFGAGEAHAPEPIPMLLWCPFCKDRHIDVGEFAHKPHHTHACQSCGAVWRPAIGPTVGVNFLPGFKDEEPKPRDEEGWVRIGLMCSAGRRSLWWRVNYRDADNSRIEDITGIELCSGREGNDQYVSFENDGSKQFYDLWGVLSAAQFAVET